MLLSLYCLRYTLFLPGSQTSFISACFFSQTRIQLSKSVYPQVQVSVSSRLAHMLLRYTDVRKSVSTIKIWLKRRSVSSGGWIQHNPHRLRRCGGKRRGETAGRGVICANKMGDLVLQRYLRLHVESQQGNKNRKQEAAIPSSLETPKGNQLWGDSVSCSCMREVEVWGELLLNSSSLEAQTLTAAQSCVPTAQPRPRVSINFKNQWWYELFQDKAWA